MFRREEVERILDQARRMDSGLEMFGASKHQYKLNPPVNLPFVRAIEEEYRFRFPEDYVQFITEIGDGGAGPGYGLFSFGFYRTASKSAREASRLIADVRYIGTGESLSLSGELLNIKTAVDLDIS